MKRPGPLGYADDRPRIHVWPTSRGAYWSFGPTGARHLRNSAGACVEAALEFIDPAKGYVVIGEVVS